MRVGTLLFGLAVSSVASAGAAPPDTGFLDRTITVNGTAYRYQVYIPPAFTADRRWPVILFLHGAGERGDDGLLQTQVGIGTGIRLGRDRFPAIVVFPQVRQERLWTGEMLDQAVAALDQSLLEFNGDPDRVYLTGISMGGWGTWMLAARLPDRFAAIVPICALVTIPKGRFVSASEREQLLRDSAFLSGRDPHAALAAAVKHLPVWIFHGSEDKSVSVEESRRMAAALRAAGADVQYTEYEGVGHNSWDKAYAETKLTEWLFGQRRAPRR
jgi:predicted peptidase